MAKKLLLVVICLIIIGSGYWIIKSRDQVSSGAEKSCLDSGGQVSVLSCCNQINDFPNLCLIGPCGCSPNDSHEVKTCDCGQGKCFNGTECADQQLLITIYCSDNNCSSQEVSQGAGSLIKGCYRDLNECLNELEANKTILCTEEERKGDVCIEIYDPVCAKVNIQCIKAPCNPIYETFSNSCIACHNQLVESYVKGECPSI